MIEMGISVIAACLPTIRPLYGGTTAERVIGSNRSTTSLHSQDFGNVGKGRHASVVDGYADIELSERTGKPSAEST